MTADVSAARDQTRRESGKDAAANPLAQEYQQTIQPPGARINATDLNGKDCPKQPGADQYPVLKPGESSSKCNFASFEPSAPRGSDGQMPPLNTGELYRIAAPNAAHIKLQAKIDGHEQSGTGSGVIVGKDGSRLLIATDNHVVNPPVAGHRVDVTRREVVLPDGKKYPARVEKTDPSTDKAFISVDVGKDVDKYRPAPVAKDSPTGGTGGVFGFPNSSKSLYASPMQFDGTKRADEIFKKKSDLLPGEDPSRRLLWMKGNTREGNSGAGTYNAQGEVVGLLEGGRNNKISYANPLSQSEVDDAMKIMRNRGAK